MAKAVSLVTSFAADQEPSMFCVLTRASAPFWNQSVSPSFSSPRSTPSRSTDHMKYLAEPGPMDLENSPTFAKPLA